jgi:hypothetical protein
LVSELLVSELLVSELLVSELLVSELLVSELLVSELLVSRRGRPNRGLASLMRPAKVAPGETSVLLPLCGAPNGSRSSHRGPLTRWKHADLRVTKVTRKILVLRSEMSSGATAGAAGTRRHICARARHPLDLLPLSGQYRVLRGLDGRRPIGACR